MIIKDLISHLMLNPDSFLRCSLGKKWSLRAVELKKGFFIQRSVVQGTQAFHENLPPHQAFLELEEKLRSTPQMVVHTKDADYHVLVSKKGSETVTKRLLSLVKNTPSHNREKTRQIDSSQAAPYLTALGVMNAKGEVYASKRDKFVQINRFIEMLSPLSFPENVTVVDFGCGKGYLTFALYDYLTSRCSQGVRVYGCDRNKSLMEMTQKIADSIGYKGLRFIESDIQTFTPPDDITMVVALHACDTATDDAISRALEWDADVIVVAPCCQRALRKQIRSNPLNPILKHGILREHFTALATDALRAQQLETKGYRVELIEFVDADHTPKNVLIRAEKSPGVDRVAKELQLHSFLEAIGIYPLRFKR